MVEWSDAARVVVATLQPVAAPLWEVAAAVVAAAVVAVAVVAVAVVAVAVVGVFVAEAA